MAESQDLEQQCVAAFKQGNHDQAVQLLPQLQQPGDVTTEFKIYGKRNRDVTLLHLAAYHGWLDIIKTVQQHVLVYDCRDSEGLTPLHYAASSGNNLAVIDYLIKTLGCDPNAKTTRQNLPLHVACLNGQLNVAKYFVTKQNCDPNVQGNNGYTPLHCASECGHMNIIQYLITELGCDPKTPNKKGNIPLHIACLNGHFDVANYFITEQNCDPSCRNKNGSTPLHYASKRGHMNIIQYLITELGCDPKTPNKNGNLPSHIACFNGHLNAAVYFIAEQNCDSTSQSQHGFTPLHYACQRGHMNIIQYLIPQLGTARCDPTIPDRNGDLPLHIASQYGHMNAVKYLITDKMFDKCCFVDKSITLHYASQGGHLNIIQYLITELGCDPTTPNSNGSLPLHIACLNGHLNAAKYFITELNCDPASLNKDGSTPLHCASQGGHMNIIQQLHYWLNFIDSATCRTTIKSCLVVVGSHADLLSKEEIQSKSTFIIKMVVSRGTRQDFMGVVTMDCHKFNSKGTQKFISLLSQSQQTLSTRAPSLSYYCHLLYAFLQSKPEMSYCKLEELVSLVKREDCPIPAQSIFLTRLLTALNDKGMVIFLKNQQKPNESWIIVKIEMLLKNINGNLFGKVNSTVKVVTGIIRSSTLKQLFPQYDLEMLVGLLQTLELCHQVNLSGIETNLIQGIETSSLSDMENCFFFPTLLTICRPSILPGENGYNFGWCLCCKKTEYQFFTSRFLHVLLLRLAYTFPLASGNHYTFHHNQTGCIIWNNGISWENEEGIRTIVELIDNQRVVVLVSHRAASRPVECNKHHSAVIRLVLDLHDSNVKTTEYLISHSLLKNWTIDIEFPSNNDLFPIENVAKSMLLHKPYILSCNNETSDDFQTKNILEFEPYYQLSPSSVCELMDSSKTDEPVSQALLKEVNGLRCPSHQLVPPQTHSSVRKFVDQSSLFAGRNILVSVVSY